jgi:nitroimidazol reductase NimA-like FMN-containing flavoprotein (pyridoxamine 5'-phosphate oxidase superfamily)
VAIGAGRTTDFARRLTHRRRELGLTADELARRSGTAAGYINYLEQSSGAETPHAGLLLRLANALETTAAHLTGGDVDRPPGFGRAGPHPKLDVLSREQCAAHLALGGIGRFVFTTDRGPVALPVNFGFFDGDIVFRTRAEGGLAAAVGSTVSFEVDSIDEAMSEGWSVLVTGAARLVDEPSELEQLARLGIEPWPGGKRETLIRIETRKISGREIRQEHDAA